MLVTSATTDILVDECGLSAGWPPTPTSDYANQLGL